MNTTRNVYLTGLFLLTTLGFAPNVFVAYAAITPGEALARYEQKFSVAKTGEEKFYVLTKMAPTALAANEVSKASSYANDLLSSSSGFTSDWNYGNAVHVGNLVLGHIALASGHVEEASRYLLAAGATPGSPQLDSFGPNMLLAKELLKKGERDVVIRYFDLCAKFWKLQRNRLDDWKAIVIKGEIPDFRANLAYQLDVWQVEIWN